MEAPFSYIKTNLVYPDCEEVSDTYQIEIKRPVSKDRLEAFWEYFKALIKECVWVEK